LIDKKLWFAPLFLLLIPVSNVHAEHVFDIEAFAQYLDISQLEAEKFELEVDENSYVLYYGYHGSIDDSALDDFREPTVAEVALNQERKSIEFTFEEIPEKTDFWVRIPFEVLTAEKENYQVFVNELDTGYDLMKMPDGYVVGLIISEDTKHVEIIGTNVIPEFGGISIIILGIAIFGIVFLVRNSTFRLGWTRIN